MCRTPWCYGDCEECIRDQKEQEEYKEFISECPNKKTCTLTMINTKTDRCAYCGEIFNY